MGAFLLTACLVAGTFAAIVSAANNIKFVNHCPYDIYSWSVGPAGSEWTGHDHEAVTIPANTVTYQGMANCELTHGGISVKLRDLPRYEVAPAGIVQVEYNLVPSKNHLWYDLSAIDCNHNVGPEHPSFCPLIGGGMKVYVENADKNKCPSAWCGADSQCHNTYKEHGFWHGEPSFRCGAGKDIVVELCTERAGPRTFNGYNEPGHHEPEPDEKPEKPTTNGICGAKSPDGATCFGYAHGNCCSQFGWCGFTDAHCGAGCQSGFGKCASDSGVRPSSYQPPTYSSYSRPSKSSTFQSIYSKLTSSYHPPGHSYSSSTPVYYIPPTSYYPTVPSYSPPAPVYYPPPSSHHQPSTTHTPRHSHVEHTWASYGKSSSAYTEISTVKSTHAYSKSHSSYVTPSRNIYTPTYLAPVHSKSTKSMYTPTYSPPPHTKATTAYSKPSRIIYTPTYQAPTHTKSTSAYNKPSKSVYTPPYQGPPHSKSTPVYSKPSKSIYTPTYHAPTHSKSPPVHSKRRTSHTPHTLTQSKHTPTYLPPPHPNPSDYIPPAPTPLRYHTIHITQTITKTLPHTTKTATASVNEYHAPSSYSAREKPTPEYYPPPRA